MTPDPLSVGEMKHDCEWCIAGVNPDGTEHTHPDGRCGYCGAHLYHDASYWLVERDGSKHVCQSPRQTQPIHQYRCKNCGVVYALPAIAVNGQCCAVYFDTAWIPRRCDGEIVKYEPAFQ